MKVVLLGAPGSGKGTQAGFISEKLNIPHISTGDIFRENMKKKTPLGLKVKSLMDSGNLCPDDLTVELIKERLNHDDCKNGYLLDGFPRNLHQAKALDGFCPPDKVLNLDVDFERIERRITGRRSCYECGGTYHVDFITDPNKCPLCGGELFTRKDDTSETVKTRLKVYQTQTEPLIGYYSEQNKLVTVDGNAEISDVERNVLEALGI
ncbi:MAG: adenylate kinase [Clostridiales bacterium]|nr:adenylate kinase [Clostridiales bacterium]